MSRFRMTSKLVIVALVVGGLGGGFFFASKSGTNPDVYANDFNVYYHASQEVLAGRDPYTRSVGDWTPYLYPPLLAELLVPFVFLPLPVAAYLWFLISAASVLTAAWLSVEALSTDVQQSSSALSSRGAAMRNAVIAAGAVLLIFRFVLDTFSLGQVNAIVIALAVCHIYTFATGRRILSALILAVAISIKLTPAILLVYHLAKLRLKFVLISVAILAALTAVSFLPFSSQSVDVFRTFWSRTVRNEQGYDFAYSGNQSIRGAIERMKLSRAVEQINGDARKTTDPATVIIALIVLGSAVFLARREGNEMASAAPFFCCFVLLSPLSWKAHYVSLIPPAALLLFKMNYSGGRRWVPGVAIAVIFLLFHFTSPRVIGIPAAEWADEHSLVLAGALVLFFTLLVMGLLEKRRGLYRR